MSEEHPTPVDEGTPTNDGGTATADAPGADGANTREFARYVNYLALAALVVLALVAGIRFYGAVSRTIDQWVIREYRSLIHAAFNLAVLLVAGAGVSLQLRRVRE